MKKAELWLAVLFLVAVTQACSRNSGSRRTIVVYSTHGKELLTEFEKGFEQENPDLDVRWLDMGSQDVLDRVRSEKENPQADVWWGAPSTMYRQAEREGLLKPYRPTWAAEVLPEARSEGDFWYGTYETPEVIAYNSKSLKAEEVPQDWDDLLDEKWRGKLILRDPLASGTMRTIFCAMILRDYKRLGSPSEGYRWLARLDANTKDYVANLTILSQKLARQEGLITLWNMPDIELQRAQYGYPLDYVIPRSGTPVVTDAIALIAKETDAQPSQRFYEFVTRRDNLVLAANRFYRIPCRKDIPAQELPEWIRDTSIKTMDLDWKTLEAKSNEWMKYWDDSIRNRGLSQPPS
ncbi:MAG: extracellular solute-binding protein [Acidobacteriota bacterium]